MAIGEARRQEQEEARLRNLIRNGLACDIRKPRDLWIHLRPAEMQSLLSFGKVEIWRAIWPPQKLRVKWCTWGMPGEVRRVAEDCKLIGPHTYLHRGDPAYEYYKSEIIPARLAPAESARFWVLIHDVVRPYNSNRWVMQLEKCEKVCGEHIPRGPVYQRK